MLVHCHHCLPSSASSVDLAVVEDGELLKNELFLMMTYPFGPAVTMVLYMALCCRVFFLKTQHGVT